MNSDEIAVGYIRVSSINQVENGGGLAIQRKKITNFCREKGYNLERFYEERGISGSIKERPALLRLLKDCESGLIKRVVVFRQDRLARELTVSLWLETQFKKYDVAVSSVLDPELDMNDPLQLAFKRLIDVFAELEKTLIVTRLREGRVDKAENGRRAVGAIAFGYYKEKDGLVVNLEESEWVKKIFRNAAKGKKYSEIVAMLKKNGVVTRRKKPFSIETVKYVLRNSFYYGESTYGDIKSRGEHRPIISKRLFVRVQKVKRKEVLLPARVS
ncbi:MAG: recombinase family protein [Candidatus Omnitrophota bacterium]